MLFLAPAFLAARKSFAAATAAAALFFAGVASAEDTNYLELAPDHSDVLAVVEFNQIVDSPAFAKLAKEFPAIAKQLDQPLSKETKLTPRAIDSVFIAGNTSNQDFVLVVSLTEEVELDDLLNEAEQAKGTKVGEHTLYALEQGQSLCLVDGQTIAVGPQKTLTAVLNRGGEAKLPEVMTAAWENIDNEQHVYVVATLDKLVKQNSASVPAGLPITPETLAKLRTLTLTATTNDKQLVLAANLDCTDEETANQLKALLDIAVKGIQQDEKTPAELKQALREVKSSTEDEILSLDFGVSFDLIIKEFKAHGEALIGGAQ